MERRNKERGHNCLNTNKLTYVQVLFDRPIPVQDISTIRKSFYDIKGDEIQKIVSIVDLLKLGEFSIKSELLKIMMESSDKQIRNLCCRLYCCVAQHSDIPLLESYVMKIITQGDDDELKSFITSSQYSLSPEVVPLLLALLDDWEDTEIEERIRSVLDELFPVIDFFDEDVSIDDIRQVFVNLFDEIDGDVYYHGGLPVFPGIWTKELLERAIEAKNQKSALYMTNIPTLLSLWTGKDCPTYFDTLIDDKKINELFEYIKTIAMMNWEKGSKYFFGHKI